ncbi:hypothetical protein BFR04_15280 [Gaetbulibacter sp. 4G1]|nr:FecR family protein [Gaetbulibacter sp. 4G1]PIA81064.1 hypothetical protein BFR04_15280 [Gaetbulibacter sp. 4G1]
MEFKLIIKRLNNKLTPEEEIIFSKWYNEADSHKDYFISVKKNYKKNINHIDIEKGWLSIQKNINIAENTKKNNYWKYAVVAASILVLISLNFIFNKEDIQVSDPVIVDNDELILIGTDKATLTLEDGSSIVLEKGETYVAGNLNSNGEKLTYNKNNNSKQEIVYNYLTIPRGGQYAIKLSDGTEVWLNSESQLKYPVNFIAGKTREVELVYGEAYFDVTSSFENNGSKFIVLNKNQEVEVLGTEFNIKAYKDESTIYTTLVEGRVTVSNSVSKQSLTPNQQSKISLGSNQITVNTVDVYGETSWKTGVFSFKSKTLKDIMVVLSRWYDVEVIFEDKKLEDVKFNGVISKNEKIEEILDLIKKTNFITAYGITNKKITIK